MSWTQLRNNILITKPSPLVSSTSEIFPSLPCDVGTWNFSKYHSKFVLFHADLGSLSFTISVIGEKQNQIRRHSVNLINFAMVCSIRWILAVLYVMLWEHQSRRAELTQNSTNRAHPLDDVNVVSIGDFTMFSYFKRVPFVGVKSLNYSADWWIPF